MKMTVKKIVMYPAEVLEKPCKPVTVFNQKLKKLIIYKLSIFLGGGVIFTKTSTHERCNP